MIFEAIEKILKKWKRMIGFSVLLLLFVGLSMITFVRVVVPESQKMADVLLNTSIREKLVFENRISQNFTIKDGTVEEIWIPTIFENGMANGEWKFTLKKGNHIIQEWEVKPCKEEGSVGLKVNAPIIVQGEKTYTLDVEVSDKGKGVGVYLGKAMWNIPETELYVDGEKQNFDMSIHVKGGNCHYIKTLFWIVFYVILFLYFLLWYGTYLKKWEIQKIFVVLAGVIGIIYIVIWGPYACPDEYQHISTSYYYASEVLGTDTIDKNGETLVRKEDMRITPSELTTRKYTFNQMRRYWNEMGIEEGESVSMNWKPMTEVFPISYFPQILAISLGRILGFGNVFWLLLGRILALSCYLLMGYFALKYVPFGKRALLVLMLGPTAIQEAASFSYDSILNSFSFFFIAYVLYMAYEIEHTTIKDWVYVYVGIIIIAPIKIVYLLLGFLVFLVPDSKVCLDKKKVYAIKIGTVLSALLVSIFGRMETTNAMLGNSIVVEGETIEGYSIGMLLSEPFDTIVLWGNTLKERSVHYLKQIFGGYEAYSKVEISWLVILGFFILLFFALLVENKERILDFKGRCIALLVSIGILGATLLAFNLAKDCTNLTSDCIYGVQGRYFLPFLPLVFMMLQSKKLLVSKSLRPMLYIGLYCMQFVAVWEIFETVIRR